MKRTLLVAAALVAFTLPEAVAQLDKATKKGWRNVAPTDLHLVPTDLSAYGIPVIIPAPADVKITDTKTFAKAQSPIQLVHPNYVIEVTATADKTGHDGYQAMARRKEQVVRGDERHILVVDEPLAYRMYNTYIGDDLFELIIPDPGRGRYYTVRGLTKDMNGVSSINSTFGKATTEAQYRAVMATKLASTEAPVPATQEVSLRLGYNVPLALKVPANTGAYGSGAADDDARHLYLRGPYYGVNVISCTGGLAAAKARFALLKATAKSAPGYSQVVVDEPMAFRVRNTNPKLEDQFAVLVENPAFSQSFILTKVYTDSSSLYTPAQVDNMFASARSARALPKPAPGAPADKMPRLPAFTDLAGAPYKASTAQPK